VRGSVFDTLSLDREQSRWEKHLLTRTPVEEMGAIRFKREDRFAPLGYGGINGAKLRQCIWLVSRAAAAGAKGLLSGASVKSPQLCMGTAVARHFGLETLLVIGATTEKAAGKHENVAIARALGARFRYNPVAYNPALQRAVAELAKEHPGHYVLKYGITVDDDPAEIDAFHRLGSEQVLNIPDDVEAIYMPAGSCNSCVSVLYGIARRLPPRLREVVLFGVGPTKLVWIEDRLRAIEQFSGIQIRALFNRDYKNDPDQAASFQPTKRAPYRLVHYDLHATHFASYQDEMPFTYGGIDFHPTYEGKVMTYLRKHAKEFVHFWGSGKALFWIVGSRPTLAAMRGALGEP